jgi:hypothetical protein
MCIAQADVRFVPEADPPCQRMTGPTSFRLGDGTTVDKIDDNTFKIPVVDSLTGPSDCQGDLKTRNGLVQIVSTICAQADVRLVPTADVCSARVDIRRLGRSERKATRTSRQVACFSDDPTRFAFW